MQTTKAKSAGLNPGRRSPFELATVAVMLALLFVPHLGHAQGIVRGAQEGAYKGHRMAGPVGGVVGGAVGAGVGGAVGAVEGVFGVPHYRRYHHYCRGRHHCYR